VIPKACDQTTRDPRFGAAKVIEEREQFVEIGARAYIEIGIGPAHEQG
jgi:hypothetical protein